MNIPANHVPRVLHAHFNSIDSFSKASGWDLDFRQLGNGTLRIGVKILANPNVQILSTRISQGLHQLGITPSGTITFGVPTAGKTDWYGRNIVQSAVMNFNHGSGFDAVSTPGFEAFTVSFSANYFDSVARSLGLSVPDQIYQPLVGSVSQSAYTNAKLRKALINLMDYQRLLLDDDSETELVTHLIDAFTNVRGKNDIPPLPVRSRSIAAAMEFIEENRLEAITVKNICEATGTSIRTLERAFKERFGIPPKSYIKRRRLTGVKAELLSLEGYISITDVANSWGFWHMGQFARDYRTVFGELPSETVRRNGSQPDIYSQFP